MNRKIVKAVRAVVMTGALVAGTFVVTSVAFPTAANASVTGCIKRLTSETSGMVDCAATGGDEYRAKLTCEKYTENGSRIVYGTFVGSGWSSATCPGGTYALSVTDGI